MKSTYYTVEQISEMIGMHPKTIRRFIREGKLTGNKVGKQWRIEGHELSRFMEGNKDKLSSYEMQDEVSEDSNFEKEERKITASAVIDIEVLDREESMNISNMLMAAMSGKDSSYGNSTMNIQLIENNSKIRVMLWGRIEFLQVIMEFVSNIRRK